MVPLISVDATIVDQTKAAAIGWGVMGGGGTELPPF